VDNTWPTRVCVCVSVIGQFGVKFEVLTGTTDDDVTPCHLVGRYRRLEAAQYYLNCFNTEDFKRKISYYSFMVTNSVCVMFHVLSKRSRTFRVRYNFKHQTFNGIAQVS